MGWWVGGTFALNISRSGRFYGGLGLNGGKSATIVSGSLTANWLWQRSVPTSAQLQSFLTKGSCNGAAGYWGGAQLSWTPGSGLAPGGGFVSPQAGVSCTYSWDITGWFR